MDLDLEKLLPLIGKDDAGLAEELFSEHRTRLIANTAAKKRWMEDFGEWSAEVEKAAADLQTWREQSGKEQVYTPDSLVEARLRREMANAYEGNHSFPLNRSDTDHLALIREDMKQGGLAKILMKGGEEANKLGLVELSARLLPALTFSGSSIYFEGGIVPYGKEFRIVIGEAPSKSFVSAAVAEESARNLQRQLGVHYALAETSAAPRSDVPKSGKKPEIYICGLVGDTTYAQHHIVDTPFREEFNAVARELMYELLKRMYGASK